MNVHPVEVTLTGTQAAVLLAGLRELGCAIEEGGRPWSGWADDPDSPDVLCIRDGWLRLIESARAALIFATVP